ncbi:HYCCIN RELATED [Salix koriyanagi]|uniref:HYCCIN RELATED n=1 Tax=Salix koriyanagi TaxID=2511006 RepID=A0A9Q0V0I2_9ROSI|nr:HYCCIN RELATED [Salix koriyanagi]
MPPPFLSYQDQDPTFSLLHDPDISSQVSSLLRLPDSGASDNNLYRWFYDTLQYSEPQLQLVVLRFLPIIVGLYLSRVPLKKPLAGFEAVLLALYAHETTSPAGQAITINVPDLSYSSTYHETKDQLERIAMLQNST